MIKPLFDKVLLEIEKEDKGGLYIPDEVLEKPGQAKVVAIGDDVSKIHVGDSIIFMKYAPDEVKDGDKTLLMIKESDILGIYE